MKLVFATNNTHKLEEIKALLGDTLEIISLKELGCFQEIPEDHDTLEGNALQKALYIHDKYHVNCFADDTGLEIKALNNAPGIYSARYAGPQHNSEANMQKVLLEMKNIHQRAAQFRTVIALILNGENYFFEGVVKGEILHEKQGERGFGYDPIFKPAGFTSSFAEMSLADKNQISHRGQATQKLVTFLHNYIKETTKL